MNKIVDNIKIIKLNGLKRRILMILNNNVKFLSSSRIRQALMNQYRRGEIDRSYSLNYVCIILRDLYSLGLIDRRTSKHSFGRASYYTINNFGKDQLIFNLSPEKNDNNNCNIYNGEKTYYKKMIVNEMKDKPKV